MIEVIVDKHRYGKWKYGRRISFLEAGNTFLLGGKLHLCICGLNVGVVECTNITDSCAEEFTGGELDWVVQLVDCEMTIKDIE